MKIVSVRVAVQDERKAAKLAEELWNLMNTGYADGDECMPVYSRVEEPTMEDTVIINERRGADADLDAPMEPRS